MDMVLILFLLWLFLSDLGNELIRACIDYIKELTKELKDERDNKQ